jgi:hypothetical protein
VDDDECKLGSHECEHICYNTIGSYDCSCLNGYKLGVDGKVCVDIEECLEREESCKSACQKECKKTIQTVIEITKKQNKKVTLIEIIDKTCITNCEKECLLCEDICTNTDGGYECGCSKGYTLDANNKTCSDKGEQARTGRDIHGIPKVSPGPAMPNPYTPCGRATPPNCLMAVWEVAHPQGERPAAVFFPLGYPYPYGPEGECHSQADHLKN